MRLVHRERVDWNIVLRARGVVLCPRALLVVLGCLVMVACAGLPRLAGRPASLATVSQASAPAGWSPVDRPRPYREQRYRGVVGQTSWVTCGPAVLATYLTYYAGRETSEAEMTRLVYRDAVYQSGEDVAGVVIDVAAGTSMLALREALRTLGYAAAGYRISVDELLAYFERGGPPLILHVTEPQHHYILGIGLVDVGWPALLAADPAYGRRLITPRALVSELGFVGYVLIPVPPEPVLWRVQERQAEALEAERRRLRRLLAAGRWTS